MVISGESKLLDISEIASDMDRLRRMFSLFEKKTDLLQLLDVSSRAQGVQIYIGGDSHLVPMDDVSVITAPYGVDGRVVGTWGSSGLRAWLTNGLFPSWISPRVCCPTR